MSHSCRTPTRPPAPTLPQDTPQNLHRPPRALHHLPCRNTFSVLLLPTKVCCYLSQGAPMFRNERIIAKFCLFTTQHKRRSADSFTHFTHPAPRRSAAAVFFKFHRRVTDPAGA